VKSFVRRDIKGSVVLCQIGAEAVRRDGRAAELQRSAHPSSHELQG
jgi:hypothetical protein